MKRVIRAIIRKIVIFISYFLPICKRKILVSSYYGLGYGDNLKYVVNELLNRDIKKLKIIWCVKEEKEAKSLPSRVKFCIIGSFKYYFHLGTSKIWLDNCRKSFRFKKKGQYYIQTWHGFALKRIEKDVEKNLSEGYVETAKKDSKAIDLIVSCSLFMEKIYKNSFWYNGIVVNLGAPRNDIIINQNEDIAEKVKRYYSISSKTKIVLYAPTFRRERSLTPYCLDYDKLITSCRQRFGDEFVVLVRLHPNIITLSKSMEYGENIINATEYPDMQELLVATDVLISDYSSLMFDFALSYKPVFIFANDIDDYKNDRNFYFDLEELPFDVAANNEELALNINSFNFEKYKINLKEFYDTVGMVRDGQASKKVVDLVLDKLNVARKGENV